MDLLHGAAEEVGGDGGEDASTFLRGGRVADEAWAEERVIDDIEQGRKDVVDG